MTNYSDWQRSEPYAQAMYIQGMYDELQASRMLGEDSWVTARRDGIANCFQTQRLTAGMLTDAITKHYQNNVDDWTIAPTMVFAEVTRRICLSYVNEERAKIGLAPWKASTGSITAGWSK
ncbi:hypothetical protein [Rhizobium sp. S96]|uniref:hypothetical protein n=1 Tax=Rhizobium sp. S96 TaxID=3055140 RepID=UPI0025AAB70D|nr:hypothetical protein [Rhizobium sp. S96]MDM9621124.1 hypothetical protein [Rhizobium sp. S96]